MFSSELSSLSDFGYLLDKKQAMYPLSSLNSCLQAIDVPNSRHLDTEIKQKFRLQIERFNLSIFRFHPADTMKRQDVLELAEVLNLKSPNYNLCADEDRISTITAAPAETANKSARRGMYIPYTTKALGWHTDGYYNPSSQAIRSFLLACENPAIRGGENRFIDPDIVFGILHRQNPDYITALSRPDVMTIPENWGNGKVIRPATCCAVFSVNSTVNSIDMRYSQRKGHIKWRNDRLTQAAIECLNSIIEDEKWHIRLRLKAGEGVICNNVLHCRQSYEDDPDQPRVYLRARFHDRIQLINLNN
ncbi:MAG: alpha-ketoglutarate-dependent taurine dioxygenase [Gammaproteobacteria bacterium]